MYKVSLFLIFTFETNTFSFRLVRDLKANLGSRASRALTGLLWVRVPCSPHRCDLHRQLPVCLTGGSWVQGYKQSEAEIKRGAPVPFSVSLPHGKHLNWFAVVFGETGDPAQSLTWLTMPFLPQALSLATVTPFFTASLPFHRKHLHPLFLVIGGRVGFLTIP